MHATPEKYAAATSAGAPTIGLFDSGIGGLSVLRVVRRRLPDASLLYVGDTAWAPYGERPDEEIVARSLRIAAWLVEQGAGIVVVPCNTATAAAIEALRARWPDVAFVGVEPGVKPAVAHTRTRRIAVMATPATIRSARLARLVERHAGGVHVHLQACAGLAGAIERGVFDGPGLAAVLDPCLAEIRAADVDTVVLGCTHYPFVAAAIQERLAPGVRLIDTADAIAARTAGLWRPGATSSTALRVHATAPSPTLRLLLGRCAGLEAAEVRGLALP